MGLKNENEAPLGFTDGPTRAMERWNPPASAERQLNGSCSTCVCSRDSPRRFCLHSSRLLEHVARPHSSLLETGIVIGVGGNRCLSTCTSRRLREETSPACLRFRHFVRRKRKRKRPTGSLSPPPPKFRRHERGSWGVHFLSACREQRIEQP